MIPLGVFSFSCFLLSTAAIHNLNHLVFAKSSGNEQRGFEGSIAALQCHPEVSSWRGEAGTRVLLGDKGP